ncbi:MAG TPA: putative LPS assembly protein LptD [Thermoanaerobaculia bacterium]|nr:putative LPS assembly protein LptD [Thermoanaerobaculia bacterium]
MKRVALSLCILALPGLAHSQTFQRGTGPGDRFYKDQSSFSLKLPQAQRGGAVRWTVGADGRQEFVRDEYVILESEVKIYYQDIVMSADKISLNLKTKDAVAEGNVVLDQGPRRLSANRIVYNLDSERGTLFEAKGSFEPSVYFIGEKIEKIDEDTFVLTNGIFTSCDIEDPSWSFKLKRGVITLDDYARLTNISFRARRAPLLWLPYIVWPTKRERSQGLLIPKPGFSSRFGSFIKTAYFVPFGDSADTTISAEAYSKGYYALGTETNYVPSTATKGQVLGYVVRDPETNDLEWKYEYRHTQDDLPGGFRGVVDVRDYSNLDFFQRFERRFELNTLSNIYSSAYLTRNRSNYSINLRADRREHFLGQESRIFEQLPSLELRTYPNRVGKSPLYFSLESSAAHLRTNLGADYYRTDLRPTLTLQLETPPWFSIKPQLSLRQTYYTSTLDPATQQITDDSLNRFYAQGEVELVGPSFSRVFSREIANFARFKHVIEPRVKYIHTTDVEDQNRVIRFDTVDSPFLPLVPDLAEYSITQRIIGKEKGENTSARDLMSFTIRQSVALSGHFQSFASGSLRENRFTPVTLTAHINPYQRITIDASASIGNETRRLDQSSLSANLSGKNSYMNLTWFATYRRPGQTFGGSSQVRLATGFPIIAEKLRADAQLNYDATRGTFLEQRYIVGFFASCYTVSLEYRDFLQLRGAVQPVRGRDYQLSIGLKNVGTFVDLRGSLDTLF